jgi:hypothetical protein
VRGVGECFLYAAREEPNNQTASYAQKKLDRMKRLYLVFIPICRFGRTNPAAFENIRISRRRPSYHFAQEIMHIRVVTIQYPKLSEGPREAKI